MVKALRILACDDLKGDNISIRSEHKDQMIAHARALSHTHTHREREREREQRAGTCLEEGNQHVEGSQPVAVADNLVMGNLVMGNHVVGRQPGEDNQHAEGSDRLEQDRLLVVDSLHAEGSQPVDVAENLVVGNLVVDSQPVVDAGDNQLR